MRNIRRIAMKVLSNIKVSEKSLFRQFDKELVDLIDTFFDTLSKEDLNKVTDFVFTHVIQFPANDRSLEELKNEFNSMMISWASKFDVLNNEAENLNDDFYREFADFVMGYFES